MLAIFSAFRRECTLKPTTSWQRHTGWSVARSTCSESEILLVATGVGNKHAQRAADAIFTQYSPSFVVVAGLAGGLNTDLTHGMVTVAKSVSAPSEKTLTANPELISIAIRSSASVRTVDLLTVPSAAFTPHDKSRLLTTYHVDAVDMESYWVIAAAKERNIDWLIVRSISDTAHDNVPRLDRPFSMLINPLEYMRLAYLLWGARKGLRALDAFLPGLISRLPLRTT